MAWEVEFTDEFAEWWNSLNEAEQEDVAASVKLLRERGPTVGRPHVDLVTTSAYANMKELRTQHDGRPYRTLFAFDPRRVAILLIGVTRLGKTGGTRSSSPGPTRFMPLTCGRLRKRCGRDEERGTFMPRNFRELEAKMSPEARARAEAKAKKMLAEMPLDELREARSMTQVHLAKILGVNQAAVSKMERRADMYVSTLQDFVKAMGGELKIVARFPEGTVEITQFEAVKKAAGDD
jgi:DNA-binding Xre family transcriptional regulator